MKAELEANGTLIVQAENGLETFALVAWFERYLKQEVVMKIRPDPATTVFPGDAYQ